MVFIHQLGIAALPFYPGTDKLRAEVKQAKQLPPVFPAAQGQNMGTAAVLRPNLCVGVKAGVLGAELFQPP